MPESERGRWRDLVERRLPEAARPDWPVSRDHCFARILLDNTCGGPWRERIKAPAWANLAPDQLDAAIALGEAVLAGRADLAALNRRSLIFRDKQPPEASPETLSDGDLVLRRWRPSDAAGLAALNADPEVMRFCPATLDAPASHAQARAWERRFAVDGFGPWAVEAAGRGFVGFVGGARLMRVMPYAGGERPGAGVEIVWRFARAAWGRGIATRATRLALADLFGRCGLSEVVAFTTEGNASSRRVMARLGMRPAGGFAHPALPPGYPLRAHLLYRLSAASFDCERSGA